MAVQKITSVLDITGQPLSLGLDCWPQQGHLQFCGVHLQYGHEAPHALDGVTFELSPGQKVGVCGRTGGLMHAGLPAPHVTLFPASLCSGFSCAMLRDLCISKQSRRSICVYACGSSVVSVLVSATIGKSAGSGPARLCARPCLQTAVQLCKNTHVGCACDALKTHQ